MTSLSSDFLQVLTKLGRAMQSLREERGHRPVLVGGAAVEIYTRGGYTTGDFDVHAVDQQAVVEHLERQGFQQEKGEGRLLSAWHHPDHPSHSVQVVSGRLFDGNCDENKLVHLVLCDDSAIVLAPVEDLIADRLGQFCSIPKNANQELLEQARLLIKLASELDWSYLERRIIEDQGDPSLVQDLRRERKPA